MFEFIADNPLMSGAVAIGFSLVFAIAGGGVRSDYEDRKPFGWDGVPGMGLNDDDEKTDENDGT